MRSNHTKPVAHRRRAVKRTLGHFTRALRRRMPELVERYSVRSLGLFGSYVRNEAKPRSDLDVLVEFDDDHSSSFTNLIALESDLEESLGVKIDLVEQGDLKPFIGKRILSEVIWLRRNGVDANPKILRPRQGAFPMTPKREYLDYLNGIVLAMERAQRHVLGKTFDESISSELAVDAVSKTVDNIGEAAKLRIFDLILTIQL